MVTEFPIAVEDAVMMISDYIVYLWMFPVVLQILLPLVILCGWMVTKPLVLLFGFREPKTSYEHGQAYAS